jgi:valyl-tRNA synthetase
VERKGRLHDIAFGSPESAPLVISTTRPELIPACVALYCRPHDERSARYIGRTARVPLSGRPVPILADEDVKTDFGTGLMMVCTFGRICLGPDGRMTELAGPYTGLTTSGFSHHMRYTSRTL